MPFEAGPPTTSFLELQNEVLNYGFADGPQVYRERVKNWLNEAQHRVARKVAGPEFQSNFTLTTSPQKSAYFLPEDFLRVQTVAFPKLQMKLRMLDLQEYDTTNPSDLTGPPAFYTLDTSYQILLLPTPDSVYTLTLRYIANPPKMVNDFDVPVLNDDYHDLLITYAVVRAFEAEDDYEAAQYFAQKYKSDLQNYATDVQNREIDRPRQVDGTWSGTSYGSRGVA